MPNAIGFLIEKEISKIDNILNENTHPFTIVIGGKKISDKTLVIDNLIKKCDYLLLGGGMCFTFLKSIGKNVGLSIIDNDNLDYCKKLINKYSQKIILPIDIVTQDLKEKDIDKIDNDDCGCDIGPKTIIKFTNIVRESKRVIINGPMGIFEEKKFQIGTKSLYETLKANKIKTLIGGGDSAASVTLLGYDDAFYHISTGGGATLEYLAGLNLPAIDVIEDI